MIAWEKNIEDKLLLICRSVEVAYNWEALSTEMRKVPKLVFKTKKEKRLLFIKSRLTLESNGISEDGKFIS